jgi:hypothetical protein
MELAEALVYLQVVVWVFTELLLKPVPNPYVPKRKLSSCSQWLQSWLKYTNDSFDNMAIYLAPLIHVKGGHRQGCSRSSQGPAHRTATPCSRSKVIPCSCANVLMLNRLTRLLIRVRLTRLQDRTQELVPATESPKTWSPERRQ